ncbi:hypothetical protein [Okeania sp.]|nr:hypothetical protein [Okeania sp.]MEB3340496.1 hypothetical protein [Okeania sp.]
MGASENDNWLEAIACSASAENFGFETHTGIADKINVYGKEV